MDDNNQNLDTLPYSEGSKLFDPATFSTDSFARSERTEWGEKIIFTPEGLPYIGSELRFEEGKSSEETVSDRFRIFVFRDGKASIFMEDANGNMAQKEMETWLGYRIHKGQKFYIKADNVSRVLEATMSEPWDGEVHREHFHYEEYVLRIGKPWGYELHFAKEDDPLMAKILHVNQGDRLSEKAHRKKKESYWMLNGECNILMENQSREMIPFSLEHGKGYTTNVGQRHRQQGTTDCDLFEVSMPEGGKTWRIEDDYMRPDETDYQRRLERAQYLEV